MARSKEFEEKEVLDKAMRLFWEQGYEKTSMTELVEHMGIHRRSLYDTFGDKHSLFLKAMDRFDDKIIAALAGGVKGSKTASEALQFIFSFMIDGDEDSPAGCLMVNSAVELAARDVEVDNKATKAFTTAEQLLKEIILWGQREGEFTSTYNAEELAEYLHNVWIGLRVMARTSASREKLHRITHISMKLLEE
ncbi:TetR/AcrR family transcriptional regulator [Paenibacillus sp. SEL1]|uniref:TetR/AcrR family transcriptional regulator n=1 Tax=Paenibacillus polymyxa TaxID=1406 RepID=A0AAE9I7M6_PAEPO|nr:TetR/AcrR family transcriptional regulator [Paenibacillus polymyxa]KAF6626412.1 TetR/AcrR family transcriptional regulator [Paenibacillus sp. EKM208P]URJ40368.1 TetR/AcrR family transcriptional regulator [Paenibacillus polymyxa]URJ48786.1 TetR/AcrR family transcriptional regulator [Paenibacillus polymyxa]